MNEEKKAASGFVKVARGAKRIGLVALGICGYLGLLLGIMAVALYAIKAGRFNAVEAVAAATLATAYLHWFVFVLSF